MIPRHSAGAVFDSPFSTILTCGLRASGSSAKQAPLHSRHPTAAREFRYLFTLFILCTSVSRFWIQCSRAVWLHSEKLVSVHVNRDDHVLRERQLLHYRANMAGEDADCAPAARPRDRSMPHA